MVCGAGNQLRYVVRYATCRKQHHETVAEHQFYTAFFTMIIAQHCTGVNVGLAVQRALVHDVEEHATGDIVRPIKHQFKDAAHAVAVNEAQSFFSKIAPSCWPDLFKHWQDAKDSTREGRIVAFADYLSVLSYLSQEIRGGNSLIIGNMLQLREYAASFSDPEFDFIRSYVMEADEIVAEFLGAKR